MSRSEDGEPRPAAAELPELTDRTLLVLDEASMIDLGQMHALLEVMPPGCRHLLVGDAFQLPPIGFGLVFHRLVQRGDITSRLEEVRRQTESSGIPAVSRAIRFGTLPSLPRWKPGLPGVSFLSCSPGQATRSIIEIAVSTGGTPGSTELLVLAPVNRRERNPDGTVQDLNRAFQASCGEIATGSFIAGDPVCFTRNDYIRDLRNGSLGRVVDNLGDLCRVSVDEATHEVSPADLVLANAMTCHRAQGSQAKTVIVSAIDAINLDPSWLYTAITRGEQDVVIVGTIEALERAMARKPAYARQVVGAAQTRSTR